MNNSIDVDGGRLAVLGEDGEELGPLVPCDFSWNISERSFALIFRSPNEVGVPAGTEAWHLQVFGADGRHFATIPIGGRPVQGPTLLQL